MKKIIIKVGLYVTVMLGLLYFGFTSAQQRPVFTPEQLEMLRIRPIPGKEGLYLMPGFDGGMSGGNIAILVTDEGVLIVDNKYSYSYEDITCLLYTSPSPRDRTRSRMPSSA